MNYKDLVDSIATVVNDHPMIVDFGYGQVSDIKTVSGSTVDYPYAFLVPGSHDRNGSSTTYEFNLIMMDMVMDESSYDSYLKIQSECQMYIEDLLSVITLNTSVSTSVTLVPFKERFQDDVAGMTATISFTLPNPLNSCISPVKQ